MHLGRWSIMMCLLKLSLIKINISPIEGLVALVAETGVHFTTKTGECQEGDWRDHVEAEAKKRTLKTSDLRIGKSRRTRIAKVGPNPAGRRGGR